MSAASETAETPSQFQIFLDRIAKETEGGAATTISADEAGWVIELAQKHAALEKRYDSRVAIERARELVAEEVGCKLSEAYRLMQRQASSKNKTLEEIAELILLSDDLRRQREYQFRSSSRAKRS